MSTRRSGGRRPPPPAPPIDGIHRRKEKKERTGGPSKRSDLKYKEIRHLLARKEREKRDQAETIIEEL